MNNLGNVLVFRFSRCVFLQLWLFLPLTPRKISVWRFETTCFLHLKGDWIWLRWYYPKYRLNESCNKSDTFAFYWSYILGSWIVTGDSFFYMAPNTLGHEQRQLTSSVLLPPPLLCCYVPHLFHRLIFNLGSPTCLKNDHHAKCDKNELNLSSS
jgi:hypothetical protein